MKPLSLFLNNFFIYEGQHTINLSNIDRCVVQGNNASGKSTLIVDSILFALYGSSRQKGQECITLGQKKGQVIFTFRYKEHIYVVNRSIQVNKTPTLVILEDGIDISDTTLKETQKVLEKILGFSKELFLNICVSVQGDIDTFSLYTPQERQTLLSEIIQIDKWDIRKKLANNKIKELNNKKENLENIKEEIKVIEDNIVSIEQIKENLTINLSDIKEKFEKQKLEIEKLNIDFYNLEKEKLEINNAENSKNIYIVELRKNENTIINLNFAKNAIEEKSELLLQLKNCNNKISSLEDTIKNKYTDIEEVKNIIELYKSLSVIKKDTDFVDNVPCKTLSIYTECPLLINSLEKRQSLQKKLYSLNIDDIEKQIKILNNVRDLWTEQVKDEKKLLLDFKTELSIIEKDLQNITIQEKILELNSFDEIIQRNNFLIDEIKKLDKILSNSYNKELEKEILEKKSILKSLEISYSDIENKLSQNIGKLSILTTNKKTFIQKLEEFDNIEIELKEWKLLSNLYDQIPSLLLLQIVPVIEEEANKILQLLNVNYYLQLKIFQETKTTNAQKKSLEIIYLSEKGQIPFENLSGSEKFKQSLALRIGLSKTLSKINNIDISTFIIDEGFGCLDKEGTEDIKNVLNSLAEQFNFFCLITHIEELKDIFNKQIIIDKNIENKIQII